MVHYGMYRELSANPNPFIDDLVHDSLDIFCLIKKLKTSHTGPFAPRRETTRENLFTIEVGRTGTPFVLHSYESGVIGSTIDMVKPR